MAYSEPCRRRLEMLKKKGEKVIKVIDEFDNGGPICIAIEGDPVSEEVKRERREHLAYTVARAMDDLALRISRGELRIEDL